jgi:hypothetical protein
MRFHASATVCKNVDDFEGRNSEGSPQVCAKRAFSNPVLYTFVSQLRESVQDMVSEGLFMAKAAATKAATVSLTFQVNFSSSQQRMKAPRANLHFMHVSCKQEKMLAGATARGISQTVLHPIDVARTRLQVLLEYCICSVKRLCFFDSVPEILYGKNLTVVF